MAALRTPPGLRPGGRLLWRKITAEHVLDQVQIVQLEEACRCKDRLDTLDLLLRGDLDAWATVRVDDLGNADLVIDQALTKSNATAQVMKQLLASLRLPDSVSGKRPANHGGAHKAHKPHVVSSLDRFKAAKSG